MTKDQMIECVSKLQWLRTQFVCAGLNNDTDFGCEIDSIDDVCHMIQSVKADAKPKRGRPAKVKAKRKPGRPKKTG